MTSMARIAQATGLRPALPAAVSSSYPTTLIDGDKQWQGNRHFQTLRGAAVT